MTIKDGIYPVVHTPLHQDESIDIVGLKACLHYYNQSDITGVTILGSGGELPYFSEQEKLEIITTTRQQLNEEKTLIAGVDAYSSKQAIDVIASYEPHIDYVLLLLCDYYQTSFEDYLQALRNIAQQSSKPILFYYFPQITKRFFNTKQLIRILSINNIIGIKDSSLHLKTAKTILNKLPNTRYFTGLSLLMETMQKYGVAGAICPIASILPQHTHEHFASIKNNKSSLKNLLPIVNKMELSANTQYRALQVLTAIPLPLLKSETSSHAKVKEALKQMGLPIESWVRAPLPVLTEVERVKIKKIMREITSRKEVR